MPELQSSPWREKWMNRRPAASFLFGAGEGNIEVRILKLKYGTT